jgi:hypothetical protein
MTLTSRVRNRRNRSRFRIRRAEPYHAQRQLVPKGPEEQNSRRSFVSDQASSVSIDDLSGNATREFISIEYE